MSKYASAIDTAGKNYIDDKATLEQLKKTWEFYPKTFVQDTTCKTHYYIKVCKNKLILKDYSVNCGQLVFFNSFKDESALFEKKLSEEAFTFNDSTLLAFNGKLKKAFRREYKYISIEEARIKLAKLVLDSNLLTIEEPL